MLPCSDERKRVERFVNYNDANGYAKIDDTPNNLIKEMNTKFKYTPEKVSQSNELFNQMLHDKEWKDNDFIKTWK